MNLSEYASYDALGLAELVRNGDVTSKELTELAASAIDQINPELNFLVENTYDYAAQVQGDGIPAGPFSGVPILKKDIGGACAGIPQHGGSKFMYGMEVDHDSDFFRRLKNTGALIIGRTTVPCLAAGPLTECRLTGDTCNPWNTARGVGGSSGGSAVAVATGVIPIAHGNDGGGSLRSPAHSCGLVAHKPTRGFISTAPDEWENLGGFGVEGILSRTVRDSAAFYDAVFGGSPGDKYLSPSTESLLSRCKEKNLGKLRIAFSKVSSAGHSVDASVAAGVDAAAAACADLGHDVIEHDLTFDWSQFVNAFGDIVSANFRHFTGLLEHFLGRKADSETVEGVVLAYIHRGSEMSAADLLAAFGVCNFITRQVAQDFLKFDVLITPTCLRPAMEIGELNPNAPGLTAQTWLDKSFGFTEFTPLWNVTGQPAMSLPLHQTPEGLPVGVQIIGQAGEDAKLFGLAAQLEDAMPWHDRKPPISVF